MKDLELFLGSIDGSLRTLDRVKAILWWVGREDGKIGLSTNQLSKIIEDAGYPKQNLFRLNQQISADKLISRVPRENAWRLHPVGRRSLDPLYQSLVNRPIKINQTDSLLIPDLFKGTRGYIEKVVFQINVSYSTGLYDCCSVMCRRLLETLIIEVYESTKCADEIRDADGNYLMFADLLGLFEKNKELRMSRNGLQGLKDFKKLGDLSAHNRRFNARKEDIDHVRDGIRIASEELLHLSKLI